MTQPGSSCQVRRGLLGGVLLGLILAGSGSVRAQASPAPRSTGTLIDGVSLVAPRGSASPDAVRAVADLSAGWVAVVPYAFLRPGTGELLYDRRGQFEGERTAGVREQIGLAREHGLKVLLKPHVWARDLWVGDYLPADGEAWRRWDEGYRSYLLQMAELAREMDVEMLAVGTELKRIVQRRPGWMRMLVAEVRSVYDGELTYAANWDAYRDVEFWDAVDFIGVNAYFPLSREPVPAVVDLVRAWRAPLSDLEAFSAQHGRPVLITEFGYRSVEGAAGPHWELPDPDRAEGGRRAETAQARAYEAFFRSAWDEPWLAGAFLWKWFLEEPSARGARRRAVGYTPQGKPAAEVIRRWYGEPAGDRTGDDPRPRDPDG